MVHRLDGEIKSRRVMDGEQSSAREDVAGSSPNWPSYDVSIIGLRRRGSTAGPVARYEGHVCKIATWTLGQPTCPSFPTGLCTRLQRALGMYLLVRT